MNIASSYSVIIDYHILSIKPNFDALLISMQQDLDSKWPKSTTLIFLVGLAMTKCGMRKGNGTN